MTFLEKIKPHLLSEDFLIQEFVLHSIHDYPNLPVEWTNQLLEEAFRNQDKLASILIYVDNQHFNDKSIKILTKNIPTMNKSKMHLALHLLEMVEPEIALRNKESMKGLIRDDLWDFYELLIHGTEEEVYSEYGAILNQLEDKFENHVYIKAKKLAAEIVKKGWVTENEIDIVMQEQLDEEWFSFNGILTVYMIGLLQMERYIPVLASLLDGDDDILLEEVSAALISFQSNDVIEAVKPLLPNSNSVIYASSIVENIKMKEAVEALREAYRQVTEESDKDIVFEALCHQLSSEALPEINTHMELEYSSGMVDIEQVLYGYYTIMGLDHPYLEVWRKVAMDQESDFRQRSEQSTKPVVKETKVGRNDPCPCGSGKKYKKCCGK
jgi:hypothetical protein